MMTAQNVNYTAEQTAKLVNDYRAGETVESIAAALGKSVKSVVAKLVREGEYKSKVKQSTRKVTKAEQVAYLEELLNVPAGSLESLQNGSQAALNTLTAAIYNRIT